MISTIQVLVLIFVLAQAYFTYLHYKRQEFTVRECLGWLLIWVSFGAVALYPEFFAVVSTKLGAIRSLDFFTIAGFVIVLAISFYSYIQIDRLRRRFERIVRELSLQDFDEEMQLKERGKQK